MTYDLFHQNGISYTDDQIGEYTTKNKTKNQRILSLFGFHLSYGPSTIHKMYCKRYPEAPLTSIRRAITTLERQGKLEKLPERKPGAFNRGEHLWRRK